MSSMSLSNEGDVPLVNHARGLLRRRVLYVSDLDGTLLGPDSCVSAQSAAMLNRAIAKGALFTVATARTPATVVGLLREVDMRLPAVVMTGAALFDFSDHSFSRVCLFTSGSVERILSLYRHYRVSTFVYTISLKTGSPCSPRVWTTRCCSSAFSRGRPPALFTGKYALPEYPALRSATTTLSDRNGPNSRYSDRRPARPLPWRRLPPMCAPTV